MDDDKMIENAAMIGLSRSNGSIELPEWINDHKKTCPQAAVTGDAESITLWDMIKIVAQIVPIALLICVVWAAW
jgi:hypothetical protein